MEGETETTVFWSLVMVTGDWHGSALVVTYRSEERREKLKEKIEGGKGRCNPKLRRIVTIGRLSLCLKSLQ